jgi:LacI family transcriptional regulator
MEDLARFCCQNPACTKYGQRNAGNLTVCGWFGKNQRLRLLYCRTCQKRFSERKGTPLFGSKLARPKLLSLLAHVSEGCGVRVTSRLVGVHRDTVTHYIRACGAHAQQLHDELVSVSPLDPRGPVRREVGLCRQETKPLSSRGARRCAMRRQLGSRGV